MNSDATWHTLLTMTAYDQTPVSVHKFLPIVSLGADNDKFISWGATIPDKYGNYYYTSFSPAGYVIPYVFLKTIGMGFTEEGLFVFNTMLLSLSCLALIALFKQIWGHKLNCYLLMLVLMLYIFSTEIMHGMGIVYWHQSLMQVLFPLQCLFYLRAKNKKQNRWAWYIFLAFCVLNPYVEWSGYVIDSGFIILELFENRNGHGWKRFAPALSIAACMMLSFALFCLHYLTEVDAKPFFHALKGRFRARNISASGSWIKLLLGYWESFSALISLCIVSGLAAIFTNGWKNTIETVMREREALFVLAFPLLENIIMKQHAISYTFDRMKLAFPLLLLLYILFHIVARNVKWKFLVAMVTVLSIYFTAPQYVVDGRYIWNRNYEKGNRALCGILNDKFSDSVVGFESAVRGYLNLSLSRGCYEGVYGEINRKNLENMARKGGTRYVIYLRRENVGEMDHGGVYCISATVLDRKENRELDIFNQKTDVSVSAWRTRKE